MQTMIITPKPHDPEIQILAKELQRRDYEVKYFVPEKVNVKVGIEDFSHLFRDLTPKRALLRGFGADTIQKIYFRLDLLRSIEAYGVRLINSREALEIASDKFTTSVFLEKNAIPTPKTIICENPDLALRAFEELGGDCLVKPLFGSKGIGIIRLNDRGFAENVIYKLAQFHEVFYLQEFLDHFHRDIRIMVIGDEAIAGMYRVGETWKTNIHAGAKSEPLELTEELKDLAVRASQAVKTEISGVDIIETEKGLQVIEVNSIPGFTALQRVCEIKIDKKIIDYFLES